MKQIISHFVQTFGVENINYPAQMRAIKKLLDTYTKEELLYAIDYYAKKGVAMYSLGYLSEKTMPRPVAELKGNQITATWSDDSGTRNQRKFAKNNQTGSRAEYYFDLPKEPDEDY